MTNMVTAYMGVLMLAMHFSSQVHAQNMTTPIMNNTSAGTNFNITTVDVNNTMYNTTLKGASFYLQSSAIMLLIPVALAGSLLQGGL